MEVKVKKDPVEVAQEKDDKLILVLDNLLKKLNTPGVVQGLLGSYLDGDIDLDELTRELEDLTADDLRLQQMIPVFNENLEADHVVDKEYGLLANYKPLFDDQQNLVGFVPFWIVK